MSSSSSRFAVAIHTLAVLAFMEKHGAPRASSQMIARSVNTNAVVIRNLLRMLKKAGLVRSREGKHGGVSLSKPPAKIRLSEIFRAVESESLLSKSKNPAFEHCPVSCAMKGVLPRLFEEVDAAVAETLKKKTLQQIIDQI